MKIPTLFFTLFLCMAQYGSAVGQVPPTMSYQGYVETGGQPVNNSLPIVVRLYTQQLGGSPIWSQSFPSVVITKGVYTLLLDVSTITFDTPYWLETEIDGSVSSARTQLTSTPYSLGPWSTGIPSDVTQKQFGTGDQTGVAGSTPSIFYKGNVGVGAPDPLCKLDVRVPLNGGGDIFHLTGYSPFLTMYDANHGYRRDAIQQVNGGLNFFTDSYLTGGDPFAFVRLDNNGDLGIGSAAPTAKLEVASLGGDIFHMVGYEPFLTFYDSNHGYRRGAIQQVDGGLNMFSDSYLTGNNLLACIRMSYDGNVGIGTLNPQVKLEVIGHIKTQVLEITGGGDFSENFDVTKTNAGESDIQPGLIVSIDPKNPGKLAVSATPFDNRVAGVISGAGGISPGMVMGQHGSIVNGKYPVALTGRVYCWADASTNPIEPGDMLTTSFVAGHAMKATDLVRASGAIIGKAMTELKSGTGLVLVLVNLQ